MALFVFPFCFHDCMKEMVKRQAKFMRKICSTVPLVKQIIPNLIIYLKPGIVV